MTRKLIFAANWKMNKGPQETEDFVKSFVSTIKGEDLACEVVIAPPFVSLPTLESLLHDDNPGIQISAQNCSQYDAGAYTGEVSALMLRELHVKHVILGHSERRSIYGETDEIINAKMKKALENKQEKSAIMAFDNLRGQCMNCHTVIGRPKIAIYGAH